MTALIKHYSLDGLVEFYGTYEESRYAIYTMGASEADWSKFRDFVARLDDSDIAHPISVSVDVANGYSHSLEGYVERLSAEYPDIVLMVGNVVTPERTEKLIECGANIVKVGVGPGSVCTTRLMTGVGYPQFSAVYECASAAEAAGGSIVADGGITCPGDVVKAFAAGAKYVMIGGYFAGHHEGGGFDPEEPNVVPFFGMASKEAQDKYNGGVSNYRASEGKFVQVPYRGSVQSTVQDLLGGIRSACTYVGAESVDQLHRRCKFIRVNRQVNNVFS